MQSSEEIEVQKGNSISQGVQSLKMPKKGQEFIPDKSK